MGAAKISIELDPNDASSADLLADLAEVLRRRNQRAPREPRETPPAAPQDEKKPTGRRRAGPFVAPLTEEQRATVTPIALEKARQQLARQGCIE